MKFISCGKSRCVYVDDGICLKMPLPGRVDAGILQNREEFKLCKLAEELGFTCLPKAFSLDNDGHDLREELLMLPEKACLEDASRDILERSGFDLSGYTCDMSLVLMFNIAYLLKIASAKCINDFKTFSNAGDWNIYAFPWLNALAKNLGRDYADNALFPALPEIVKLAFARNLDISLEELWNIS